LSREGSASASEPLRSNISAREAHLVPNAEAIFLGLSANILCFEAAI